jgi:hypothetical protein
MERWLRPGSRAWCSFSAEGKLQVDSTEDLEFGLPYAAVGESSLGSAKRLIEVPPWTSQTLPKPAPMGIA